MTSKAAQCKNLNISEGLAIVCRSGRLTFCTYNRFQNALCPRSSFFRFFFTHSAPKVAPKVASRQAQGGPKGLKGISKPPPRQLKIIEKSTWDPTRVKRGSPAGSRGAPGRENYTKIDLNATISMPTEKKMRAFRVVFETFLRQ